MNRLLMTTALGVSLSGLGSAWAQPQQVAEASIGVEEILVTARRRVENIQTVPVAVTALTQTDLGKRGNFNVTDLSGKVPSLNFNSQLGNRNDISPSLRGQSIFSGGSRFPPTMIYFAEVPILRITRGQFYDLESIQVLRGPQGTLFGRVTDGGNIMLAPKKPTNVFEGYIEGTGGNYKLHHFSGAINIPIVKDKLMIRGAFDINRRDGFTTNILPGVAKKYQDLDNIHYDSFRGSVLVKPTEDLENLTIYAFNQANENGTGNKVFFVNRAAVAGAINANAPFFGLGAATPALGNNVAAAMDAERALGVRTTRIGSLDYGPNAGQFNKRQDTYVINTTTFHINDNLTLKNILGYVRIKNHAGADFDGSSQQVIDNPNLFLPEPNFNLAQYSEEFQIQGKVREKLDFTVGTYWDFVHNPRPSETQAINFTFIYRSPQQSQQTQSKAAYAQFGYDLSDILNGLKLDAGIRYTDDRTKSSNTNIIGFYGPAAGVSISNGSYTRHGICPGSPTCQVFKASSQALTYTIGLNYQVTDRTMVYGKVSRGYRPGGANSFAAIGVSPIYDPEYNVSMEFGGKSDYHLGPVFGRTNVAVFRDNYSDIQKSISIVPPSGTITTIVTNAADAHIWGVELEQTIVPVEGLTIKAEYSHLEGKYAQASQAALNQACFAPFVGFCTLHPFQGMPKNSLNVSAHYTLPLSEEVGEITFGGGWYHRGRMATENTTFFQPHQISPGYDLYSLDASWNRIFDSQVDASFFMTNVTNKTYITGTTGIENTVGFTAVQYGEPRMWGFTMRYNFGPR